MIEVRPAELADVPAIAELAAVVHAAHAAALPHVFQPPVPPPLGPADVVQLIAAAGPLFLVAVLDGAFAGYARAELRDQPATAFKRASRVLHVHEMGVVPAHRRHGVGRALLRAAQAAASAGGSARARGARGIARRLRVQRRRARVLRTGGVRVRPGVARRAGGARA